MAYMIKHNYEPCDKLRDNKMIQENVLRDFMNNIKSKCNIVKTLGVEKKFYYIEIKEPIDKKQTLKIKEKISSNKLGNIVYLNQDGTKINFRVPIIVEKEQLCFILSCINEALNEIDIS